MVFQKKLTAIMIHHKNTKAMVQSSDGDTDFLVLSLEFSKVINWHHFHQ